MAYFARIGKSPIDSESFLPSNLAPTHPIWISKDDFRTAFLKGFRLEAFLRRVRITTAASYNRVRASVSPHFEILRLRSTSPD